MSGPVNEIMKTLEEGHTRETLLVWSDKLEELGENFISRACRYCAENGTWPQKVKVNRYSNRTVFAGSRKEALRERWVWSNSRQLKDDNLLRRNLHELLFYALTGYLEYEWLDKFYGNLRSALFNLGRVLS